MASQPVSRRGLRYVSSVAALLLLATPALAAPTDTAIWQHIMGTSTEREQLPLCEDCPPNPLYPGDPDQPTREDPMISHIGPDSTTR